MFINEVQVYINILSIEILFPCADHRKMTLKGSFISLGLPGTNLS